MARVALIVFTYFSKNMKPLMRIKLDKKEDDVWFIFIYDQWFMNFSFIPSFHFELTIAQL